jgi:hypothetical protein
MTCLSLITSWDLRPIDATRVQTGQPTLGFILPLASALPADEIAFWKWQEHAVDSRIIFDAVQELRLEAGEVTNVRVFCEIRFQRFGIGFVRRRDITHFADPSDRNEVRKRGRESFIDRTAFVGNHAAARSVQKRLPTPLIPSHARMITCFHAPAPTPRDHRARPVKGYGCLLAGSCPLAFSIDSSKR